MQPQAVPTDRLSGGGYSGLGALRGAFAGGQNAQQQAAPMPGRFGGGHLGASMGLGAPPQGMTPNAMQSQQLQGRSMAPGRPQGPERQSYGFGQPQQLSGQQASFGGYGQPPPQQQYGRQPDPLQAAVQQSLGRGGYGPRRDTRQPYAQQRPVRRGSGGFEFMGGRPGFQGAYFPNVPTRRR